MRAARGDLRVMSAGEVIEIYKDVGLPEVFAEAFELDEPPRLPCARPHAHGDREPRHDRGLASVLDRARPLPRPQRLALEPQHAAPGAAARGDRVPDRERHRGRGRLPRVAAARGCLARAGARGLPRRSRRLLHLRGRHGRRLRGAARPDRLQAGGARRDRRVGRDGVRVPRDRRAPRRRRRARCGSPSRASSTSGTGRPSRERNASKPRSSISRSTPLRELNQRLHDVALTGDGPAAWRIVNPRGAHAVACGLDAELDVEIDGHVGLLLRRHEPARDRARARQREHRDRREHDVRAGSSSRGASASRPERPRTAACSSSTATRPRAAGSR